MLLPSFMAVKKTSRLFWPLLAGAFLLKLWVIFDLKDHPLLQPDVGLDTTAYVDLARRVLAGDIGLGPGLYFVSPLYIYFLALNLALWDSFTAVRLVQAILGTASVAFIFMTAEEWAGRRAAWCAGLLAALTGLFTFYETLIMQAAIDPFLTSAALLALTIALRRGSLRFMALSGVVFGVHCLNRPNVAFGVAAIVMVLLLIRQLRLAGILVIGLSAGMSPVAIRNVTSAHQWSMISSHGGLNFYIGNGEGATGFYRQIPGITPNITGQEKDARRIAEAAMGRPVSDAEASGYFFGLAWKWIREHPMEATKVFIRKLGFVFSAQHVALPHSFPFYAYDVPSALRFLFVGPWLLLALGLVGLVVAAPLDRRPEYFAWTAFVPGYAIGVAAFFVAERYRLPLLVPLCIGAGAALDAVTRMVAARRTRVAVMGVAAFAALAIVTNLRHRELHDGRWDEGLRLAQQLVILERYDEAEQWVQRIESRAPRPGATQYGIGAQLLAANRPERAVEHLEKALQLDPGRAGVEYALGQALLQSGRPVEAMPHLQAAIRADIERDAEAWLQWGRLAAHAKAHEAAEPLFRHAVQLRPDQASARQQYGLNLVVLGRCEEAARELSEAVRLDSRDPDSLAHLAYCEVKLGRVTDARAHIKATLSIDPDNALASQLDRALRVR